MTIIDETVQAEVSANRPLRRAEDLPDLLTRVEVSEYLSISVSALARYAVDGTGPKITRVGRGRGLVRYAKADVLEYIGARAA